MNIILIGAQGSGKGTQAQKLVESLGVHHVSSGDLFRKVSSEDSELGRRITEILGRGELVPDELTVSMVLKHISQPVLMQDGVLLDGFPRTIAQAVALDDGLASIGLSLDQAIYLEVPEEVLLKRLSGRYICRAHQHVYNSETNPPREPGICDLDGSELYQRPDDLGAAVQKRLEIFFKQTIQLLDYYRQRDKLIVVDGNRSIEDVHQSIRSALV